MLKENDADAIKQHLRQYGIRGCSTCGEEEMDPFFFGRMDLQPKSGAGETPAIVLASCKKCGRVLMFLADAISGLSP